MNVMSLQENKAVDFIGKITSNYSVSCDLASSKPTNGSWSAIRVVIIDHVRWSILVISGKKGKKIKYIINVKYHRIITNVATLNRGNS